jgi:hypothetical protein
MGFRNHVPNIQNISEIDRPFIARVTTVRLAMSLVLLARVTGAVGSRHWYGRLLSLVRSTLITGAVGLSSPVRLGLVTGAVRASLL